MPSVPGTVSLPAVLGEAQQAHRRGELPRAEALYRAVLAAQPGNYEAVAGLATLCIQAGRLPDAERLMGHALQLRPGAVDMLANLGVVLLALGRPGEALGRCDQALAQLPDHAALHYNRGNALRSLGRLEEALGAYERAVALAPAYAEAQDNRGVTLGLLGRWPEALAAHDLALAARAGFAEAHYNRGLALAALERHEDAAAALRAALEHRPDLAEAHYSLGVALFRLKRYPEALQALDQALALRPTLAEAHNGRALVLFDLERYEDAAASLRQALALRPGYGAALQLLGLVRLRLGDAEESVRLALAAMDLPGSDERSLLQTLGRGLAAVAAKRGHLKHGAEDDRAGAASRSFFRKNNLPPLGGRPPRVSIVAPCYNHERFVAEAIASVARQTYPDFELIVIDDGSTDGSVAAAASALADCPFPHRLVHRENRGAHATLNEGIALATGDYVGILNTDDLYAPERVEYLVRALAASGSRWGFSNLAYMDGDGRPYRYGQHPRVDTFMALQDRLYQARTLSEEFAGHNYAISTGNLFFERSLWQEVGGFEALRYNHDWAFCLAAVLRAEPAYVDAPLYHYRIHGSNTITEHPTAARDEADALLRRWHQQLAEGPAITNGALAEARQNARDLDFATMSDGFGHVIDPARLRAYAAELGF